MQAQRPPPVKKGKSGMALSAWLVVCIGRVEGAWGGVCDAKACKKKEQVVKAVEDGMAPQARERWATMRKGRRESIKRLGEKGGKRTANMCVCVGVVKMRRHNKRVSHNEEKRVGLCVYDDVCGVSAVSWYPSCRVTNATVGKQQQSWLFTRLGQSPGAAGRSQRRCSTCG